MGYRQTPQGCRGRPRRLGRLWGRTRRRRRLGCERRVYSSSGQDAGSARARDQLRSLGLGRCNHPQRSSACDDNDDQGRVRRNRETGHRRDQGVLRRLLAAKRQGEQVRLPRMEVHVSRHRRGTGNEQPGRRYPVV